MNSLTFIFLATVAVAEKLSSHYQGPLAQPKVLSNGYLADTHEVAIAKSAHLATMSYGQHYGNHGHDTSNHVDDQYNHGDDQYNHGDDQYKHGDDQYNHGDDYYSHGGDHYSHGDDHYSHGDDQYNHGNDDYNHGNDQNVYSHGQNVDFRYHGPTAVHHVLHDGHIADTPEVASARAEHLSAIAKAKAHGGYQHGSHSVQGSYEHRDLSGVAHDGLLAKPILLHSGYLADTHEVAAARAQHLSALAKAKAHEGYQHGSYERRGHSGVAHDGLLAKPVLLNPGYLADTHEVAAARAQHLSAVAKAKAHEGYQHGSYERRGHSGVAHDGLLAKPVLLHSGYLADTHEVATARQQHLEALHYLHPL